MSIINGFAPSYISLAVGEQWLRECGKGGRIAAALAIEFARISALDQRGPATAEELADYEAVERGDAR
jgi:hypothetical protein